MTASISSGLSMIENASESHFSSPFMAHPSRPNSRALRNRPSSGLGRGSGLARSEARGVPKQQLNGPDDRMTAAAAVATHQFLSFILHNFGSEIPQFIRKIGHQVRVHRAGSRSLRGPDLGGEWFDPRQRRQEKSLAWRQGREPSAGRS